MNTRHIPKRQKSKSGSGDVGRSMSPVPCQHIRNITKYYWGKQIRTVGLSRAREMANVCKVLVGRFEEARREYNLEGSVEGCRGFRVWGCLNRVVLDRIQRPTSCENM